VSQRVAAFRILFVKSAHECPAAGIRANCIVGIASYTECRSPVMSDFRSRVIMDKSDSK